MHVVNFQGNFRKKWLKKFSLKSDVSASSLHSESDVKRRFKENLFLKILSK